MGGCCSSKKRVDQPINITNNNKIPSSSQNEHPEEETKNPDLYRKSSCADQLEHLKPRNPTDTLNPMDTLKVSNPDFSRKPSEINLHKDLIQSIRRNRLGSSFKAFDHPIDESKLALTKEQHDMLYQFAEEKSKALNYNLTKLHHFLLKQDEWSDELMVLIEEIRNNSRDLENCVDDLGVYTIPEEARFYSNLRKDMNLVKDVTIEQQALKKGVCGFGDFKQTVLYLMRKNNISMWETSATENTPGFMNNGQGKIEDASPSNPSGVIRDLNLEQLKGPDEKENYPYYDLERVAKNESLLRSMSAEVKEKEEAHKPVGDQNNVNDKRRSLIKERIEEIRQARNTLTTEQDQDHNEKWKSKENVDESEIENMKVVNLHDIVPISATSSLHKKEDAAGRLLYQSESRMSQSESKDVTFMKKEEKGDILQRSSILMSESNKVVKQDNSSGQPETYYHHAENNTNMKAPTMYKTEKLPPIVTPQNKQYNNNNMNGYASYDLYAGEKSHRQDRYYDQNPKYSSSSSYGVGNNNSDWRLKDVTTPEINRDYLAGKRMLENQNRQAKDSL